MGIKRFIRTKLIENLPNRYQLVIERLYLYHYYGDSYIGKEVKLFKQLCNPHKTSLDIGANDGDLTLFLCKLSSHVYCFEPVPSLAEYLDHRFHGCNVSVENCALGDVNDELYLNVPLVGKRKFETRSSLIIDFETSCILGQKITEIEKIKVKVKRLDDFKLSNIGFMKIDVEGFELQVLKGAIEAIEKNMPNMLIEIEQRHHKNCNIYDIFRYIVDLGYSGYFIYNKELINIEEFDVKKMQKNEKSNDYVNNFIFTPSPIENVNF